MLIALKIINYLALLAHNPPQADDVPELVFISTTKYTVVVEAKDNLLVGATWPSVPIGEKFPKEAVYAASGSVAEVVLIPN